MKLINVAAVQAWKMQDESGRDFIRWHKDWWDIINDDGLNEPVMNQKLLYKLEEAFQNLVDRDVTRTVFITPDGYWNPHPDTTGGQGERIKKYYRR